jgi:hypothetical protein
MRAMKTSAVPTVLAPLLIAALTGCTATSPAAAPGQAVAVASAAPVGDSVGSEALTALAAIPVSEHGPAPAAAMAADPLNTPVPGRCADARRIITLDAKYKLSITSAEHDQIAGVLNTCG